MFPNIWEGEVFTWMYAPTILPGGLGVALGGVFVAWGGTPHYI